MIILDTNVVSESFRPRPNNIVMEWLDAQTASDIYICAPVLAELSFGIERIADGARKDHLRVAIERLQNDLFRDRILPFDIAAAVQYGRLVAHRERIGRPIQQMDALIAAIGLSNQATLATRNIQDFGALGLTIIDPFASPPSDGWPQQ